MCLVKEATVSKCIVNTNKKKIQTPLCKYLVYIFFLYLSFFITNLIQSAILNLMTVHFPFQLNFPAEPYITISFGYP